MTPLPEADDATRQALLDWMDRFAAFVRDVDYASARPMWHPDVVIFGTFQDLKQGLETAIATQWDNVWPHTADFRFEPTRARIFASADRTMATVIAPWTSTGFARDGTPFDRPGRATLIFQRQDDAWVVVHSHLSLNKGVPQDSHGDRPVKAR